MGSIIDIKVEGLKELDDKLLAIGKRYGYTASVSPVRKALGTAAKVVQLEAQEIVRKKTHTLEANIIVTKYKNPPAGEIGVMVTVRAKAQIFKSGSRKLRRLGTERGLSYNYGPLFYARFLEFGDSHQQPYPFLRPAFQGRGVQLTAIFRDALREDIIQFVRSHPLS